jgi:hypothetical protein
MTKTDLQKEWKRRIALFKASGQSQLAWCRSNDLSVHQLRYWLKKLNQTQPKSKMPQTNWLQVSLDASLDNSCDSLRIQVGEASIEVKPGFNPALLADVIRVLKTL